VLRAVHECDVARAQDHLGVGVQVQQQRVLAAAQQQAQPGSIEADGVNEPLELG
jgi:hypothetical protein